jgi:hypothetical protein
MDCREFRELLGDETDGRLAPADAQRLAAHVALCAACAEERGELASLRAGFRAMPRPAVPQEFRAQVMERLPRGRVLSFPRALGWIAAVAAVAVVAVTILNRTGPGAEREVASATRLAAEKPAFETAKEGDVSENASDDLEKQAAPSGKADDADRELLKLQASDDAKTPGGEKASDGRADAPAESQTPPAPAPPPAAAPSKAAAKQPAPEPDRAARARVQAEDVRYVVFRDQAAALRFAASLGTPPETEKDKAAAATPVAPPKPSAGAETKSEVRKDDEAREESARKKRDVLAEAAFTERRVVARTAVAASLSDVDVAAALAAAGGEAVPPADAAKFRELLDLDAGDAGPTSSAVPAAADAGAAGAPPPASGASAAGSGAADPAGATAGLATGVGGGTGGKPSEGFADKRRGNAQLPRVIVIVVLGPPPAAGPAPK